MKDADHINLTDKQFEEFYQHFGSNTFQLQSKALEDLGTKQLDIYFKSIGFATTVIGAIGLIAGFGFTALDYVQVAPLFFIGEGLLLAALFYGLFWTQQKYQAEFQALEAERSKHMNFYEERNAKFMEVYNSYFSAHSVSEKTLTELIEIDKRSLDLSKTEKNRPSPAIYSQGMYILMIAGASLLFSSFFILDLLC